ncbi:hypothetical protein, partial [Xanthomonas oryzae]|uniref:hypothetical protein n=1 Tax=Xanthomonas oryzae TaxID=347 RepID=UPI00117EF070
MLQQSGIGRQRPPPPPPPPRVLFGVLAPADPPVIGVAVGVEGGGFGPGPGAPMARRFFDAWLRGKMPAGREPLDSEL